MTTQTLTLYDTQLELHPLRALYWPATRSLLLADLHLGKAAHFRRHGIAAPANVGEQNLTHLHTLMRQYNPTRVLLLGDLFHSTYNADWAPFCTLMAHYPGTDWVLIRGNHDILPDVEYRKAGLHLLPELNEGPFRLIHEPPFPIRRGTSPSPLPQAPDRPYTLCGHVHPAVLLTAPGQQALRLPAFWFGRQMGILPAFGQFTGLYTVQPQPGDPTYVVTGSKVLSVKIPTE